MLAPRTDAGRAGLAALRHDPAASLVAVDYDGTLAPIVDDPTQAVPAPGAVEALAALGTRVAVVTGRPAAVAVELGGLAAVPGLVVMGQYGLDRWVDGELTSPEPLPAVQAARDELTRQGIGYEDKGLSLVVHGRRLSAPEWARLAAPVTELGTRLGLEVHRGRLVLELRPPGFDKARALLAVADPLPAAVLFAGDDIGDGAGFDAVAELRRRGVPGVTVFSDSAEGPAELRQRADLVVDGPSGVVALLAELLQ